MIYYICAEQSHVGYLLTLYELTTTNDERNEVNVIIIHCLHLFWPNNLLVNSKQLIQ